MNNMEAVKRNKKKEELGMCAFCRKLPSISDEESIERVNKLIKKGSGKAVFNLKWLMLTEVMVCHKIRQRLTNCF